MTKFYPLTTIEGISSLVNYDNIIHIVAMDNGAMITFSCGETLMVKEHLNLGGPRNDEDVLFNPEEFD